MSGSCSTVEESSAVTTHQTDDFSQSEPDSALGNSAITSSHERHSQLLIPEYVFDRRLRDQFKSSCTGDDGYGPWLTLLYRIFHAEAGFDVTFKHWMEGTELTVHYIIKLYGGTVACVIEIKPGCRYESARHRAQAHQELKNKLLKYTKDDVGADSVDVVYGLQCLGDRFMVMNMNPKQRLVTPALRTHLKHTNFAEVAPKRWWCHNLNKRRGRERLIDLANEIRLMTRMFRPVERTQSLSDSADSERIHPTERSSV